MTNEHPITPPRDLYGQWYDESPDDDEWGLVVHVATQAARWGADEELEACCEWLHWQNLATHSELIPSLRAARRPKPPSLKEQALEKLAWIDEKLEAPLLNHCDAIHIIRRALEQLDD